MTYLYIWRFQPFHLWHLDAIQQCRDDGADHVIIGVWSSTSGTSPTNPRTLQQRSDMLQLWLQESNIDMNRITLMPIPDFATDSERYEYIIDRLPSFDVVVSGNERVQEIFDSCSYEIFDPEANTNVDTHATQVRQRIVEKNYNKAQEALPTSVWKYIQTHEWYTL